MPEDELVTEEETAIEPFMVEDKDTTDEVCLTCSKFRVGSKVCGIFKPYRDYMRLNGVPDVEETFTCGEYQSEE